MAGIGEFDVNSYLDEQNGGSEDFDVNSYLDSQSSASVAKPEPEEETGDFMRGVKNFGRQEREMLNADQVMAGVAMKKTGIDGAGDSMIESGLEGMGKAQASMESKGRDEFTTAWDEGAGSLIDWLQYQAGQTVGNVGTAVAASYAGAAIGGTFGSVVPGAGTLAGGVGGAATGLGAWLTKKAVGKVAVKEARDYAKKYGKEKGEEYLKKKLNKSIGSLAGTAAFSTFMSTGEVGGEMVREAVDSGTPIEDIDFGKFLKASGMHLGAEFAGERISLGALGRKFDVKSDSLFGKVAKVTGRTIGTGLKETPVEVFQTGVERWATDKNLDPRDPETRKAYINAGAAGFAMGGITGAAGGIASTMREPSNVGITGGNSSKEDTLESLSGEFDWAKGLNPEEMDAVNGYRDIASSKSASVDEKDNALANLENLEGISGNRQDLQERRLANQADAVNFDEMSSEQSSLIDQNIENVLNSPEASSSEKYIALNTRRRIREAELKKFDQARAEQDKADERQAEYDKNIDSTMTKSERKEITSLLTSLSDPSTSEEDRGSILDYLSQKRAELESRASGDENVAKTEVPSQLVEPETPKTESESLEIYSKELKKKLGSKEITDEEYADVSSELDAVSNRKKEIKAEKAKVKADEIEKTKALAEQKKKDDLVVKNREKAQKKYDVINKGIDSKKTFDKKNEFLDKTEDDANNVLADPSSTDEQIADADDVISYVADMKDRERLLEQDRLDAEKADKEANPYQTEKTKLARERGIRLVEKAKNALVDLNSGETGLGDEDLALNIATQNKKIEEGISLQEGADTIENYNKNRAESEAKNNAEAEATRLERTEESNKINKKVDSRISEYNKMIRVKNLTLENPHSTDKQKADAKKAISIIQDKIGQESAKRVSPGVVATSESTNLNREATELANSITGGIDKDSAMEVRRKVALANKSLPEGKKITVKGSKNESLKSALRDWAKGHLVKPEPVKQEPAKPIKEKTVPGTEVVSTKTHKIFNDNNEEIDITYKVVDIDDLTATVEKADNQFRNRKSKESQLQINDISKNLLFERAGISYIMGEGAPVLTKDGKIIAGNGRVMAISDAYKNGRAERYTEKMMDELKGIGIDAKAVKKIKQPVLIRVINDTVDVKKMAMESNESGTAAMSELEQSSVDAERMGDVLNYAETNKDGSISEKSKLAIAEKILSDTPGTQRGNYVSDGKLTQQGSRRVENAILNKAYGESDILQSLIESRDDNLRNIGTALLNSAPTVATTRADIDAGLLQPADILESLIKSIDVVNEIRKGKKRDIDEYFSQLDAFEKPDPSVEVLAKFIDSNIGSHKKISELLVTYSEELKGYGNPNQESMFEQDAPTVMEVLNNAIKTQDKGTGSTVKQETGTQKGTNEGTGQGKEQGEIDLYGDIDNVVPFKYMSGMTSKSDFLAAVNGGAGIGIDFLVMNKSAPSIQRAIEAALKGSFVFIDSGAFRVFKSNLKNGTSIKIDFDKVFDMYEQILSGIVKAENEAGRKSMADGPSAVNRLLLSMPDIVGDQSASLELIKEYKDRINKIEEMGAEIIVPFQSGPADQKLAYKYVEGLLGHKNFVVGIPSNAEAMSNNDVIKLLEAGEHSRIHILGATQNDSFKSRIEAIKNVYQDTLVEMPGVTADGNTLRSNLNNIKGDTKAERRANRNDYIAKLSNEQVPEYWRKNVPDGHVEVTINGKTDTVNTDPSEGQIDANNYKKAHPVIKGFDISIENPAGSKRRPEWPALKDHYGDLKRTQGAEGNEGEGVDVFVNAEATDAELEGRQIYVVDQMNKDGTFDEHKVIMGAKNSAHAKGIYRRNYSKGWDGAGKITKFTAEEFKDWVHNAVNTSNPAEYNSKTYELDNGKIKAKSSGYKFDAIFSEEDSVFGFAEQPAFIIDQLSHTRTNKETYDSATFDKHVILMGFETLREAKQAYLDTMPEGWNGFSITRITNSEVDSAIDSLVPGEQFNVPKSVAEIEAETINSDEEERKKLEEAYSEGFSVVADHRTDMFKSPRNTVNSDRKAENQGELSKSEADKIVDGWKKHAKDQNKGESGTRNSQKIILSLFDDSGAWSQPWADAGYDVRTIDLKSDDVDVMDIDAQWLIDHGMENVYGVLAACPCTSMTSTGARDWKDTPASRVLGGKDATGVTHTAIDLTNNTVDIIDWLIPRFYSIENPPGRINSVTNVPGTPALSFQPNHYGADYSKRTMLYGNFSPDLPTANTAVTKEDYIKNLGSAGEAKGLRSLTPEGFAYSFFMANNAEDNPAYNDVADEYVNSLGNDVGVHSTLDARDAVILGIHYENNGVELPDNVPEYIRDAFDYGAEQFQDDWRLMGDNFMSESELEALSSRITTKSEEDGSPKVTPESIAEDLRRIKEEVLPLKSDAEIVAILKDAKIPVSSKTREEMEHSILMAKEAMLVLSQYQYSQDVIEATDAGEINKDKMLEWAKGVGSKTKTKNLNSYNTELVLGVLKEWGTATRSFNLPVDSVRMGETQRKNNEASTKRENEKRAEGIRLATLENMRENEDLDGLSDSFIERGLEIFHANSDKINYGTLVGAFSVAAKDLRTGKATMEAMIERQDSFFRASFGGQGINIQNEVVPDSSKPVYDVEKTLDLADEITNGIPKKHGIYKLKSMVKLANMTLPKDGKIKSSQTKPKLIEELESWAKNFNETERSRAESYSTREQDKVDGADLLGDNTEGAQAVADAQAKVDEKMSPGGEQPSDAQSGDDLFANEGKLEPDLFDEPTALDKAETSIDDAIAKKEAELSALFNRKGSPGSTSSSNPIGEILYVGTELAVLYIAKGVVNFAQFSQKMIDQMAKFGVDPELVKPHIASLYSAAMPKVTVEQLSKMDDIPTVRAYAEKNLKTGNKDAKSKSESKDGTVTRDGESGNRQATQADGRTTGNGAGSRSTANGEAGSQSNGSVGVSTGGVANEGTQSDSQISITTKAGVLDGRNTDTGDSGRSTDNSSSRTAIERDGGERAEESADNPERLTYKDAGSDVFVAGDIENIKQSLPQLFNEQQEDIVFAEERLNKNDERGVLFTNGTGTGKTFTGLGVIKRYLMQGKGDIIITVPNAKIRKDWIKTAKDHFGIDITALKDTKDAGKGIVITTYANIRKNNKLMDRTFDLVVHDEVHELSSAKSGGSTSTLEASRALTGHKGGNRFYGMAKEPDLVDEIRSIESDINRRNDSYNERLKAEIPSLERDLQRKNQLLTQKIAEHSKNRESLWESKKTKRLDLSATPFAYVKSVSIGEGFLFDYPSVPEGGGYNSPDSEGAFFIEHFGYRMRVGKLTAPEAEVDSSVMERRFNSWLKEQGALRGRRLSVDKDYSREFIETENKIGNDIDNAVEWVRDKASNRDGELAHQFGIISGLIEENMKYHHKMRLLESIKAGDAVKRAKKHMALGRQVVIFHGLIQGGITNPFNLPKTRDARLQQAIDQFNEANKKLVGTDFNLTRPLDLFKKEFGDQMTEINGTISNKKKEDNPDEFNDDESDIKIIVVQQDAGKAGISLHDTTGKSQRVLINIGLPVKPVQSIQIEGRIFRVGQMSNAVFEYFTTGTTFERRTFAESIAERAGTAENLSLGEEARALTESFVTAFEYPNNNDPSTGQGTGGKETDTANNNVITPFDEAKSNYFGTPAVSGRRDQRQGEDYYATPDPVGLKMVEWANMRPNDRALEPSAGHGAIARYFPSNVSSTFIEPSSELMSRLSLRSTGRKITDSFENLSKGTNFDAIVMNPPYGSGGATAIKHLSQAMTHLTNGGRIVALLPDGPASNKKLHDLVYGKENEAENIKERIKLNRRLGKSTAQEEGRLRQLEEMYIVTEVSLPTSTFKRAGTQVKTKVVIIDRYDSTSVTPPLQTNKDINGETVNELFDNIENITVPERIPHKKIRKARVETGVQESIDSNTLDEAGLKVTASTTAKGDPVWDVTGETRTNKEMLKSLGAKWSGWKKSWSFYDGDPTYAIEDKLNNQPANSRISREPTGSTVEQVEGWLKGTTNKLGKWVKVKVVQNVSDLPIDNAPSDVRGMMLDGTVYVVANNVTKADVKTVFQHESVGHLGLERLMGREGFNQLVKQIQSMKKSGNKRIAKIMEEIRKNYVDENGNYTLNEREESREILAHLAEKHTNMAIVKRVWTAIKRFFARYGMGNIDDAYVQSLIVRAAQLTKTDYSGFSDNNGDESPSYMGNNQKSEGIAPSEELAYSRSGLANMGLSQENQKRMDSASTIVKRWFTRNLSSAGLTGKEVHEMQIQADTSKDVGEQQIGELIHDFQEKVAEAYGAKNYSKINQSALQDVNDYLAGKDVDIPSEAKGIADVMRAYLDNYSKEMINTIDELMEIKAEGLSTTQNMDFRLAMETGGREGKIPANIQPMIDLMQKIKGNMGQYLHRSYQAFDDKNWMKKVMANEDLMERAEDYIREINPQFHESEVRGAVLGILQDAKDSGNFMSYLSKGSKEGAKDTSILKKKNDSLPDIMLELLGEYKDPRINFVRSASSMQWYVANHRFLSDVRKKGRGVFLFDKETSNTEGDFVASIAGKNSETMNPLAGMFSTEDFRTGLEDSAGNIQGTELMQTIVKYNSVIKYGKTVLAPTTQARNFLSASMFAVANGHWNPKYVKKAFDVTKSDLFTKDSEWRDYLNELIGLGVIHNNPHAQELKEAIKDFTSTDVFSEISGKSKAKSVLKYAQKFYQAGDDFWKIIGYENELATQLKLGLSKEEAQKKAAYRIRNGYPTYSMVPKGIRAIRRWVLIGTFVSFPWEMMRTTKNQMKFIAEDWKDGNKTQAVKRASGLAIVSSAAYVISKMSMLALGMDDEDDEAVRAQLPEWSRNSQLWYTGLDKNGMPTYVDLSYLDPFTYLKKPITSLFNGNNVGFMDKVTDSLVEFGSPFIGADIAAGVVRDIITNKKASSGTEVYNEQDSKWEIAKSIIDYADNGLLPGVYTNVERTIKAVNGEKAKSGREYKVFDELVAFGGIRVGTLNLQQSMKYKAYGFLDERRDSSRILSRTVSSLGDVSNSDIKSAYDRMINGRLRAYSNMEKYINGARKLGVSEHDIRKALTGAGVSMVDTSSLMQGKLRKWRMPKSFMKNATKRAVAETPQIENKRKVKKEMRERRRQVLKLIREA